MKTCQWKSNLIKKTLGFGACLLSYIADAQPPSSLARLSFVDGTVSFLPASSKDWIVAPLNRPLVSGDKLWGDSGGRAEIEFRDSAIRIWEKTSINALNLADKTAQVQLSQGSLCIHVTTLEANQIYEVDTPNLAFSILQPGDYRVDVSPDGKTTMVYVRSGESQVSIEGNSYKVAANQFFEFSGKDLTQKSIPDSADAFDTWCSERNALLAPMGSGSQYVSTQMPGGQQLQSSGTWSQKGQYGTGWSPSNVPQKWAPYSEGNWTWINSLGWTWIDNQPWGYAPFHYGRWRLIEGIWVWFPGRIDLEPIFVPALVVFLGGIPGPGGPLIGWFPIGPDALFFPPFLAGIDYLTLINFNNTFINIGTINDFFINQLAYPQNYIIMVDLSAFTIIPLADFANGVMVGDVNIDATQQLLDQAKLANNPGVAPTDESLKGGAEDAAAVPPPDVMDRPAIAKTAPPPAPVSFDQQKPLLNNHPGVPLNSTEIGTLRPGKAPPVTVIVHVPPPKPIPEDTGVARPPKTEPQVITSPPVIVTPPTQKVSEPVHVKPQQPKPPKVYYPESQPKPKWVNPKPPVIYHPKPKPPVIIYHPKPRPPVIYHPKPKPPVIIYHPKPKPPVIIHHPKPKPPIIYHPKPPVIIYKPKPRPKPHNPPMQKPHINIYQPNPKPQKHINIYNPQPQRPAYPPGGHNY